MTHFEKFSQFHPNQTFHQWTPRVVCTCTARLASAVVLDMKMMEEPGTLTCHLMYHVLWALLTILLESGNTLCHNFPPQRTPIPEIIMLICKIYQTDQSKCTNTTQPKMKCFTHETKLNYKIQA